MSPRPPTNIGSGTVGPVAKGTASRRPVRKDMVRSMPEKPDLPEPIWGLMVGVLASANKHAERRPMLQEVVVQIHRHSKCEAVGIRILDRGGCCPYEASTGFPDGFCERENSEPMHAGGSVSSSVLRGTIDPAFPFCTSGGAFCVNGMTRSLATLAKEARDALLGMCGGMEYESVALVPIRHGDHTLGLIHLADSREGKVPLSLLSSVEWIALRLGETLARIEATENLRVSGTRLEAAHHGAQLGEWDLDPRTGELYWSEHNSRVLGLPAGMALGSLDAFMALVEPGEQEVLREGIREALSRTGTYDLAMPITRPDGTRGVVRNRGQVIVDEAGEAVRMVGTIEDVTLSTDQREALQRSEERFRKAIAESPLPTMIHADDGQVLFLNKAWIEMTGYTPDDLPTVMHWLDKAVVPREPRKRPQRDTQPIPCGNRVCDGEFAVVTRSGLERVWDISSAPLGRIGRWRLVISVANDITEGRRAKEELLVSQRRLKQALKTGRMGYFDWDLGTNIVLWSEEIPRMLGMEPHGLPPTYDALLRLVPAVERARLQKHLEEVARGGCPLNVEHTVTCPDGQVLHLVAKGDLVCDDTGHPRRLLGILLDLTEIRRIEEQSHKQRQQLEQAAKMASVGVLASGVAHEINNPNYLIMLNISLLRTVWDNIQPILDRYSAENGDFVLAGKPYSEMRDEVTDILSDILGGSERIKRIVQELRDFARQPVSSMSDSVNVNTMVEKALVLLANVIKKSTSRLQVDYALAPPSVLGSAQRLEQVVVNLIHNACQALPDTTRGVYVRTRYRVDAHEMIVEVQDEGIGIPAENIPRITEPFFTTKRESGGTGLGLSVSANIVREHHGRLEFSSTVGAGTLVRLILPVVSQGISQE